MVGSEFVDISSVPPSNPELVCMMDSFFLTCVIVVSESFSRMVVNFPSPIFNRGNYVGLFAISTCVAPGELKHDGKKVCIVKIMCGISNIMQGERRDDIMKLNPGIIVHSFLYSSGMAD